MKHLRDLCASCFLLLSFLASSHPQSPGEPRYISFTAGTRGFVIASQDKTAPILVSDDDWPGVVRGAGEWSALIQRADTLAKQLPSEEQASFFELVKYPVDASGNMALMEIAAGRNAFDARLGRMQANDEKLEVERRFALAFAQQVELHPIVHFRYFVLTTIA